MAFYPTAPTMAFVAEPENLVRLRRTRKGIIMRVMNSQAGREYGASILEKHRIITFVSSADEFVTGRPCQSYLGCGFEAILYRPPPLIGITFAPVLAVYVALSTKITTGDFCDVLAQIMQKCDINLLCANTQPPGISKDAELEHICESAGTFASFGSRRSILGRRLPCIFLIDKAEIDSWQLPSKLGNEEPSSDGDHPFAA